MGTGTQGAGQLLCFADFCDLWDRLKVRAEQRVSRALLEQLEAPLVFQEIMSYIKASLSKGHRAAMFLSLPDVTKFYIAEACPGLKLSPLPSPHVNPPGLGRGHHLGPPPAHHLPRSLPGPRQEEGLQLWRVGRAPRRRVHPVRGLRGLQEGPRVPRSHGSSEARVPEEAGGGVPGVRGDVRGWTLGLDMACTLVSCSTIQCEARGF